MAKASAEHPHDAQTMHGLSYAWFGFFLTHDQIAVAVND
jgi:hypothetical protein